MSTELKFEVARITDNSVISKWRTICEQLEFAVPDEIKVAPVISVSGIPGKRDVCSLSNGPLREVLDVNGIGILTFHLPVSNQITLRYQRQFQALTDSITFETRPEASLSIIARLAQLVRIEYCTFDAQDVSEHFRANEASHLAKRTAELDQLAEIRRGFFGDLRKFEKDSQEQLEAHRERLRTENEEKAKKLDELFQEKTNALEAERNSLNEERKKYETREPKYVRREQCRAMAKEIKERRGKLRLSFDTHVRMLIVALMYIVLLAVFFLGAVGYLSGSYNSSYSMTELKTLLQDLSPAPNSPKVKVDSVPLPDDVATPLSKIPSGPIVDSVPLINWDLVVYFEWARLLRPSLMMVGFVVTASFFIKWLNKWLRDHADAEFGFIKFGDDFERANWLVEIGTEWTEERKEPLPEYLVERLSQNLFRNERSEEMATTALDAIAKAVKGGKFRVGDIEMEVGRPKKPEKKD